MGLGYSAIAIPDIKSQVYHILFICRQLVCWVPVYFEAATVILTLVLLGQLLEARAHSKTNNAVKELLKLAPNKAIRIENGEEVEISIDDIKVGDLLRVKPGDKIPVDGKITKGKT